MNSILIPFTLLALGLPVAAREPWPEDEPPPHPPHPIFKALDTDGDHVLSEKEIAAASEVLRKLDKNGDGKLDPQEILPRPPTDGRPDRPPLRAFMNARGERPPHDHPLHPPSDPPR